jgi:anhydro-N-acetylmuramic acid kinase
VTEVVAAGGGTRNPVLMDAIARRLPGVSITTIDAFGVPQAAKEALMIALVGFLTAHGLPGTIPSCTGARHATVLGSIVPGSSPLQLDPDAGPPARVLVRTPLAELAERQPA